MIEIAGLYKAFGELQVLKNINITIQDGEIFGLAGKSGVGKSTLLRCINGLESYDRGNLRVDGVEISSLNRKEARAFKKEIGMIFQQFSLLNRLSVFENVALPLKCWNYERDAIKKRVTELLDLVGISDKAKVMPRLLSGGQKQRVAIARALAMSPKILLCDECTSALDPRTAQSILKLLSDINRQTGITIVVVTHQMGVLRSVCERVAVLEEGKVSALDTVEKIFLDPPPGMKKLAGDDEMSLPDSGINLKVLLPNIMESSPVLTQMARRLEIDFQILGGGLEVYRDNTIGSVLINVEPKDFDAIAAYLKERQVQWHRLEGRQAAASEEEVE